jgi:hypothetical protein
LNVINRYLSNLPYYKNIKVGDMVNITAKSPYDTSDIFTLGSKYKVVEVYKCSGTYSCYKECQSKLVSVFIYHSDKYPKLSTCYMILNNELGIRYR